MADRDFDSEFSLMASPLAARDPELVEHYRAKMFDDEPPETSDEAMEAMISVQYALV
jgi:hypothetical protein